MTFRATATMAAAIAAGSVAIAQQPPATEVYLAALGRADTPLVYGPVVNISKSPDYDNQPSFLPDGSGVLFTSRRGGEQTDIYRYDVAAAELSQVTRTAESEYSPTPAPDGGTFSVVRVEADGTQRLWRFDLDGSNPRLVLENVKPVGYHAWIDPTRLALFVLGSGRGAPSTLQLADTATGAAVVIEPRIGRSILVRPGRGTVSFVSQPATGHWMVKELDPRTRQIADITPTVDDNVSQDCAWDPVTGFLLMPKGSQVWAWHAAGGWRLLGDLADFGLGTITRLAVNPDPAADPAGRLAVVAEPRSR
jgi:dipeptidyl aminopeptidase/acylaminoacyl peptidase